jgi:hypothetical protein
MKPAQGPPDGAHALRETASFVFEAVFEQQPHQLIGADLPLPLLAQALLEFGTLSGEQIYSLLQDDSGTGCSLLATSALIR